jgi:glyoxylase-like metal-dependent hydrolase (beta-lactamase superfamily II)
MPHGSRLVGDVEIVALCDGVTESSNVLADSFPGVADWEPYRKAFPDVFSTDGTRWRFHVHAFVIRTGGLTVLVDTGVGPQGTPWPEWAGEGCGRLADELRAARVAPSDVDVVVLTHVHDDHFGGFTGVDATVRYPKARHVMRREDWDALHVDPEDEVYVRHSFQPVHQAGLLDLIDEDLEVAPGVRLLATPGHTPGHQSLLIESAGETGLIAGDVLNHPGQIADRFPSGSDDDPRLAADTRERVLSRVERESILLSTAHLTEPFGHVELEDGQRVWRPR